ncbi:hypothetical protein NUW54_g12239 [Trametes sanguinea]|uniref:Uncharacterized protein n=1 Tax=Trametes sanguinea TaxID=158606 RepID=A0ACC1MZZ2_9APHY|nr:hypothetical protein NUW54_g12239 [Trametes sanguinea]
MGHGFASDRPQRVTRASGRRHRGTLDRASTDFDLRSMVYEILVSYAWFVAFRFCSVMSEGLLGTSSEAANPISLSGIVVLRQLSSYVPNASVKASLNRWTPSTYTPRPSYGCIVLEIARPSAGIYIFPNAHAQGHDRRDSGMRCRARALGEDPGFVLYLERACACVSQLKIPEANVNLFQMLAPKPGQRSLATSKTKLSPFL